MTTYKGTIEIEAIDIPTMRRMSTENYQQFLANGELFWVDHHDVLRSTPAEYPIATTRQQLDMLIKALETCRERMVDE